MTSAKSIDKNTKSLEPAPKKFKKKSIFSPENSSESDSGSPVKSNLKSSSSSNSVSNQKTQSQQNKIKPSEQKSRTVTSNRPSE